MKMTMALALVCVTVGLSVAQESNAAIRQYDLNIPRQTLDTALKDLAQQTGLQIARFTDNGHGSAIVGPVRGAVSAETALDSLLAPTGLTYRVVNERTIAVMAPGSGTPVAAAGSAEGEGGSDPGNARTARVGRIAQNQTGVQQSQASRSNERQNQREKLPIEEIVVTGTHIKGLKDQFSPVKQISREEMELAGFNNVSEIFETMPQNFGGGATIDTVTANSTNGPGGAGLNLRGLGNQATLILLNGRRLAPGGGRGNFVDISAIPTSAVERVEVLTDGASAIYGSDAIAGVVNIIMRDDFEGAETRLNVGTITDGGGDYLTVGQTLGWSGDRAHAMVTYEYSVEDELDSTEKDFAVDAAQPTWLLPDTERHSVFASTGAQLSDRIKLSADGYFNDRRAKQFNSIDTLVSQQNFQETDVQQYGGTFGLDVEVADDWNANLSGSYSKSDQFNDIVRQDGTGEEDTAVTAILAFDATVGGSLFNITDDPVKGVVGVHYRSEEADLLTFGKSSQRATFHSDKSRDAFAAFAEFYAPIVSDSNRMPGIESLALSVSARFEHFDDVGSSTDPKVGVAWSPVTDLNLRGTYSTSFRAPRLDQLRDNVASALLSLFDDPMAPDGESVALLVLGSTDELDPERSRTWTAGFDFSPDFLDGLLLRGTYFNTVFRDQVGVPTTSFGSDLRFTNFTGIPIRNVSQDTVQDFCSRAVFCTNLSDLFPTLGDLSFDDVEVLLDQRFQNLSLSKAAGFDFAGRYDLSSAIGDWRFSLRGTLLTTFEQKAAPATPIDDLLNTFGNPVDLKLRGGVQWRTESMTTSVFINHTGNYIDDEVPTGVVPIDSFTTVDATIRLDLGKLGNTPLTEGTFFTFSAINLLNEDPPRIDAAPLRAATFDAANANPVGRKIRILLTKQWQW